MPRRGRAFEILVHTIERADLASACARIESPAYLPDRDTGRRREHDIVIYQLVGSHEVLIALECRDQRRPVGVPAIEAFADKCMSTGISKAVMVSTSGFRQSALEKARSRSVQCLSLSEALHLEWCHCRSIEVHTREISDVIVECQFDLPVPEALISLCKDHVELTEQDLKEIGLSLMQSLGPIENKDILKLAQHSEFKVVNPLLSARFADGSVAPVSTLRVLVEWKLKCIRIPWLFLNRKDDTAQQKSLDSFALATISKFGIDGSLLIRNVEGSDGAIYWIPKGSSH